ncbi:MAG TPA: PDZ domain-containing protein [Longimicrobiales bacterium]
MVLLAASALSGRPLHAQSATIANVHFDLTFDTATARSRSINMSMQFDVAGNGPVLLSLPVWTPGAYEVTYFDKNVLSFTPTSGGKPLAWDKTSYSKYRIQTAGAKTVRIDYVYRADSLDNAMAWSKPNFLLVNGTNVFLYPEGASLNLPATVTVHTQPDWKVATAMTPAGAARTFRESNYHDLVDMPFFIGAIDFDSAQANGKWNRLASYPAGTMDVAARSKLLDQIGKLLASEAAVLNEMPWQAYTTMIIWDSAYGGASALEHQRSHVGIYRTELLGQAVIPAVTAHEMFHAWNVKRLRPSEMWPYRYDAEQPTPWLWVSEGVTDYYADLAMVRSGVASTDEFLASTGGKIANVDGSQPVALEDASLSTWIHPRDGTGYLYYPKGSLAGLMLDILIRDASNNHRSLDTVMRELYTSAYKNGRGFTAQDFWGAVSRAAGGKSFTEFNARYIDGRDGYPWTTLLPLAGLRLHTDTIYDPRLGISVDGAPDAKVRVTDVVAGSAAAEAGVQAGDIVVSVGTVKISNPGASFDEFRRVYAGATTGSPLPIVVLRNSQEITLAGKLRQVPRTETKVTIDSAASAKAARIRDGILKGVIDS